MQKDEIKCLKFVIDAISKRNNSTLVFNNIEDDNYLLKILKDVTHNPNASEFSDFLSNDAIVEHFSFTSSKDNRKGSNFRIEQNKNSIRFNEYIKEWENSYESKPFDKNKDNGKTIDNEYTNFSYDNFIISFNKHLRSHIDSLKKYNVNNKKVIFLMEQQDVPMCIYKCGVFYSHYKFSKDKKVLDILKPYIELLDTIIFTVSGRIEIIDMKKFDDVYKNFYIEEDIRGGRLIESNTFLIFNVSHSSIMQE